MNQYILAWAYDRTPFVAIIFDSIDAAKGFCREHALKEQLIEGSIVIQEIR